MQVPDLEKSAHVVTGARGKDVKSVIYVFEDANCIYCHYEYRALAPYYPPGRLVLITCEDWNGTTYLSNAVVFADPV